METVPCIRIGHLSDAQRRAYILADNRLAEIGGGWDKEMIALELIEIKEDGLDIDLTGFDDLLDQAPVRVDAVDSIKEECCLQIVCKNWDERTEAESILGGRKIAWADLRKLSKI
jgi:hypothetical protein